MTGEEMRGRVVPPFIGSGERIVVDTSEVTYMRRAD
jgi:elongation factor P